MLTNVVQDLQNSSLFYKTAFGITAGIAIESAIRIPIDAYNVLFNSHTAALEKAHKWDLSANLGGALFYVACAVNIIPYSAVLGAALFTTYALVRCEEKDNYSPYIMAKIIGKTIKQIGPAINFVVRTLTRLALKTLRALGTIFNETFQVVGEVLSFIARKIEPVMSWIVRTIADISEKLFRHLGTVLNYIYQGIKEVFSAIEPAISWIVKTTANIAGKTLRAFGTCLKEVFKGIGQVLKLVGRVTKSFVNLITLPTHPIWYGLFFLGTAAFVYHVAIPALLG